MLASPKASFIPLNRQNLAAVFILHHGTVDADNIHAKPLACRAISAAPRSRHHHKGSCPLITEVKVVVPFSLFLGIGQARDSLGVGSCEEHREGPRRIWEDARPGC